MPKLYVGVTDNDWFDFLRARPNLDEANFWKPGGGTNFRALSPGELFLFKLHAPQNFIVGGGYFSHFSPKVPVSVAWDAFGEKNGVGSFEEMRRRIELYRRTPPNQHDNYEIGCIILRDLFYFDRIAWIPVPDDFSLNTVQGKTYSSETESGQRLLTAVDQRRPGRGVSIVAEVPGRMFGAPRLVRPRLGQGAFRLLVADVYARRCAITRECVLPVLQAAHILPVKDGGQHRVDNGLLLRSDVHTLFDLGYLTVGPDYLVRVSPRLKNVPDGGASYTQFDGQPIDVPTAEIDRPSPDFLAWHLEKKFLQ